MRSATSRAAALLFATAALAALPGCGGELGIRVTVTMDPLLWLPEALGPRTPIDHVMVTVTQGERIAAGCLFPKAFALDAVEAPSADRLACASIQTEIIDSDLTPEAWRPVGEQRSINFVVPSAEAVDVRASGGFGARTDMFVATARGNPDSDFPEVALELEPDHNEPIFNAPGCPIDLSDIDAGTYRCDGAPSACLLEDIGAGSANHTEAAHDVSGGCAIFNAAGSNSCLDPTHTLDAAFVGSYSFLSPANPEQVQANNIKIRGHFVGCVDELDPATCVPTIDCVPPKTWIGAAALQLEPTPRLVAPPWVDDVPLSCLPPTMAPVEFQLALAAKANVVHLVIVRQEQIAPQDAANACVFVVRSVDPS